MKLTVFEGGMQSFVEKKGDYRPYRRGRKRNVSGKENLVGIL